MKSEQDAALAADAAGTGTRQPIRAFAVKPGWETKKLGDLLTLEYGKPLPQEDRRAGGKHPAFGANGVLCRTDRFYHDKESIIVGRKGSAGELTLTPSKFWPLVD